ncbi:hypothetical protein EHF33_07195 [Deinococcus psychrotolerans]|uniref:Lipoprotein n=1 Tax=Deinococcus psychrotolerans TaxID=2489213 RepID=A0A3G8YN40_9DEIO|nr:hypothetical protein [Deinococcus psychrotolerans]AZI42556.1 hypothetical protein EHF33_07195 [Deinococcus psychrotolerans]
MNHLLTSKTAFALSVFAALGLAAAKCDTAPGKLLGGLMPLPAYLSAECGADYAAMRQQQVKLAEGMGTISTYELYWVAEKSLKTLEKDIKAGLKAKGYLDDMQPFKLAPLFGKQRADATFSKGQTTWRVMISAADDSNAGFTGKAKQPYFLIAFKLK